MGRPVGGRLTLQKDAVVGNPMGNSRLHLPVELTDRNRHAQR